LLFCLLDGVVVNFHLFGIKLFQPYILLDVVVNEAYRLFSLNLHRCFALFPVIDPLAELDIDIQSFDIPRAVTVYPDRAGVRWWTKAWFNNREEGEASVEIEREQAIRFIHDNIEKDVWLEEFYPKQMEIYHNAIEQTKEQLLMNRIG
jgi:hypothetical protein